MKKKKSLLLFVLVIVFALSTLVACKATEIPGPSGPIDKEIEIELPDEYPVIPIPDNVAKPARPTLPEVDATKAPFLGKSGKSTDAYELTEIKDGEALKGASVSYPKRGSTLTEYNFVYFDVYNYTQEYKNIRIDLSSILSAEKISVALSYVEQGADEPEVGVLVESIMDGALSYAVDLSNFHTVDSKYVLKEALLSDCVISRVYIFIDSNPSQRPQNKEGSLDIANIRFLKDGDENLLVDNSPQIGEATTLESKYTLSKTDSNIFKAEFAETVSNESFINVPINRFSAAYGTFDFSYTSTNVTSLTLKFADKILKGVDGDGKEVTFENYAAKASETLKVDIRGQVKFDAIKFFLNSTGATTTNNATFEVTALNFVYTPYIPQDWDATSKMFISEKGLGGKVKAVYDKDIGFDFLAVPVKHWIPKYSQMIVKFKTWGGEGAAPGMERYGLAVNSNNTLLRVEDCETRLLPYDAKTKEYTLTVDLGGIKKLVSLNFYFDSWPQLIKEEFTTTRTVQFTSIEFAVAAPVFTVGAMTANKGFTVNNKADGSSEISWVADREAAFTQQSIKNYDGRLPRLQVNITNTCAINVTMNIYKGNWSENLGGVTVAPNETKNLIIPLTITETQFDLYYFLNLFDKKDGSVTINKLEFIEPALTVGDMIEFEGNSNYTIDNAHADGIKISWGTNRVGDYSYTYAPIAFYTDSIRYLNLTLFAPKETKLAVYSGMAQSLQDHTMIPANEEVKWIIDLKGKNLTKEFNLTFFWDSALVTTGEVYVKNISFSEKSTIPVMSDMEEYGSKEYTVVKNAAETKITWDKADRGASAYYFLSLPITSYSAQYKYLKIVFNTKYDLKLGITEVFSDNEKFKLEYTTFLPNVDTEVLLTLSDDVPESADGHIWIRFYFDATLVTDGEVTIKSMEFSKTAPSIKPSFSQILKDYDKTNDFTLTHNANGGTDISWSETKLQYSKVNIKVRNLDAAYTKLRIVLSAESPTTTFGIYALVGAETAAKEHTAIGSGEVVWEIDVPVGNLSEFTLYGDGGKIGTAGKITIKSIEFFVPAV